MDELFTPYMMGIKIQESGPRKISEILGSMFAGCFLSVPIKLPHFQGFSLPSIKEKA